ncbi:hypothetical protein DL769_003566 [Monosporascus sp. CRB-8-3]|nr:hypothetical protein DL769_003566 [Monosporascus sp. CRB-8-3]
MGSRTADRIVDRIVALIRRASFDELANAEANTYRCCSCKEKREFSRGVCKTCDHKFCGECGVGTQI